MDLEHHLPAGSRIAGRIAALPKDTPAGSGLAPTPQNLNRNHKRRGGFLKGFINCDQLPMAVTHVIQAAVMTPSKDFSRGGRRQGRREEGGGRGGKRGGEQGLRSHPAHSPPQPPLLALNRSRTPSAGGGRGQL